jgi:hypothetical protein
MNLERLLRLSRKAQVRSKKLGREIDERIRDTQRLIDEARAKFEEDRRVSNDKLRRLIDFQAGDHA